MSVPFLSNPRMTFSEMSTLPYPYYEKDVVAVLDSVKKLFSCYFPNVDAHPLSVKCNAPFRSVPETVYELSTIFLVVSPFDENGNPGCFWSQFIYQFSHEFCHYMNWGHVVQPMRWFEESLCELASFFFLIKSSELWKVSPPYPTWASYSDNLLEYFHSMEQSAFPVALSNFSMPDSSILRSLESNEYKREVNKYIALRMLPIFMHTPSLWKIIPFLTQLKQENDFPENLELLGNLSEQNIVSLKKLFGL